MTTSFTNRATAKDIMTMDIHAADEDWTIDQLANFFDQHQISGAPVTDQHGEITGVVSLTDIVRQNSLPVFDEDNTHHYYQNGLKSKVNYEEILNYRIDFEHHVTVRQIMTPIVFEVDENTPLSDVAGVMLNGHIHRVFVTREKRIVGIITAMDMLKIIRDQPLIHAA